MRHLVGTSPEIHEIGAAILNCLCDQKTPLTERQIDERVSGRKKHKVLALRSLVRAEIISRTGTGKKGDPYKYQYALKPDKVEEPNLLNLIDEILL